MADPTTPEVPALTDVDRREIADGLLKIIAFVSLNPPPHELLVRAIGEALDSGAYQLSPKLPRGEGLRFLYDRMIPDVVRRAIALGAPAEAEAAPLEGTTSKIPTGGTFQSDAGDDPRPGPGFTSHRRRV